MKHTHHNFAFIDSQNVHLGVKSLGWRLDYRRFRIYLADKYGIKKAFLFLGYLSENEPMYQSLRSCGFELVFKPTIKNPNGIIKGNVDAELVLHTMIEYPNFDKAIIVTSDGDFACLVKYLLEQNKLGLVFSPTQNKCSTLLKNVCFSRMAFFDNILHKICQKI